MKLFARLPFFSLRLPLVCAALISFSCSAEVYKWTDANGKVHYSDKMPEHQKSVQDVTDEIKEPNSDSSQKEQQKMERIFRKENDYDKAIAKQTQQQQAKSEQEHQQACANARQALKRLEGRVVIMDQNGQAMRMTEAERREKAQQLRNQINEQCSN